MKSILATVVGVIFSAKNNLPHVRRKLCALNPMNSAVIMKPLKLNLLSTIRKLLTATKTPHSFHLNKQHFDTDRMTVFNNVPRGCRRHFQEGCSHRKAVRKTGPVGRDATRRDEPAGFKAPANSLVYGHLLGT